MRLYVTLFTKTCASSGLSALHTSYVTRNTQGGNKIQELDSRACYHREMLDCEYEYTTFGLVSVLSYDLLDGSMIANLRTLSFVWSERTEFIATPPCCSFSRASRTYRSRPTLLSRGSRRNSIHYLTSSNKPKPSVRHKVPIIRTTNQRIAPSVFAKEYDIALSVPVEHTFSKMLFKVSK